MSEVVTNTVSNYSSEGKKYGSKKMSFAQGMATQKNNYSGTQNSKAQVSHTRDRLNEVITKMQGSLKKNSRTNKCVLKKPRRFLQKSRHRQWAKSHLFMLDKCFKRRSTDCAGLRIRKLVS